MVREKVCPQCRGPLVEVRYPASAAKGAVTVKLRGWNVVPAAVTAR